MENLVEIRWHGRGGQGTKTASLLLADAAFNTGKYIQGFPEYGPERMGAPITAYNRISNNPIVIHSNIYEPDYVVVVDDTLLESVDVLLADLPCSGLGIMGRKNDIKYQMTQQQLSELAQLQRNILSIIWKYVKPGGEMIFSTCTLNRGENVENIRWIEENTPMRLVSIEDYLPENLKGRTGSQGYLQLIPGKDSCDGFFISKFERPEAR